MNTNVRFGNMLYETEDYMIYNVTNIKYLITDVKIWRGYEERGVSLYNREKNDEKVKEIYESLLDGTIIYPSILYISEIYDRGDRDFKLRCWDGQHRWSAIKKYYQEKHVKDITNVFICIIYKNDTNKKVYQKFYNLNQFTPANLFTQPPTNDSDEEMPLKDAKRIILTKELVAMIKNTWPTLISTANCPRKPHYNVDNLNDVIYEFIKENNCENMNYMFIMKRIEEANDRLKQFYTTLYITKRITNNYMKAKETNCYLFLTNDFIEHVNLDDTPQKESI